MFTWLKVALLTLFVTLFVTVPAFGQLPDAPAPQQALPFSQYAVKPAILKPAPRKVIDRKFALVEFGLGLAIAADATSTVIGGDRGCVEQNPILGPHPGAAKVAGYSITEFGIITGFNYWMKRRIQHKREGWAWTLPSLFLTADHSIAAGGNVASGCGW